MLHIWRNMRQFVVIAMLAWGSTSFAALPSSAQPDSKDLQTISSWMSHLNHYYPSLDLSVSSEAELSNPIVREQLIEDLGTLEEIMGRGVHLPNASLKQLACGRPECTGGGGGGKCSTCQVDKE